MTRPSAHDWLRPRLVALFAEAAEAGFGNDVCVAVITDLVNGPLAAPIAPPSVDNMNQDIGEPESAANAGAVHQSLPQEPANIGLGHAMPHGRTGRR